MALPAILHRASVYHPSNSQCVTVLSTGMSMTTITHDHDNHTLHHLMNTLPSGLSWAIDRLKNTDEGQTIAEAIQQNQAVAVSDGSLKNNVGTAAFVLKGATSTH